MLRRGILLALATATIYSIHLPGYLLLAPLPAAQRRFRNTTFAAWSRLVTAILGVRIDVHGQAPRAPFLLVSNHLGYLDIPLLAGRVGGRFVAKSEVRRWPIFGLLSRSAGTLFIDRRRRRDTLRIGRGIADLVSAGDGVMLFPEGTSTAGEGVGPFRSSLLAGVASAGIDVHTAAITYATPAGAPPATRSVCWWGDMEFGSHFLALLALPRIHARLTFGPARIREDCRKRLAARLHEAVRAQFIPVDDRALLADAAPAAGVAQGTDAASGR